MIIKINSNSTSSYLHHKLNFFISELENNIFLYSLYKNEFFVINKHKITENIFYVCFDNENKKIYYRDYNNIYLYNFEFEISCVWLKNFRPQSWFYISTSKTLIFISEDLNLERIDLESKEVFYSKKIEYHSTYDPIDLSNDNRYLAIEGDNNSYFQVVKVYDVETGNLVTTLSGYDIEDDKKHLEYQLNLDDTNYFSTFGSEFAKVYYKEYHDEYFSKIGTDEQFFYEASYFIKSIVFSQDSKELLIYCKGDRMDHTKIFDTETWELKERIYDYVKEDAVFMKDSNLIVSFDSYSKTTNIYSRLDKKIIKTIDKVLHFSSDKTKYGKFIIENGENYFEIKDIDDIFNE